MWFKAGVKSNIKSEDLSSDFTFYAAVVHKAPGHWTCIFVCLHGQHTVLHPSRRTELIVHIAISVLPGTHFQMKHWRVKYLAHRHKIKTMSQDWEGRNIHWPLYPLENAFYSVIWSKLQHNCYGVVVVVNHCFTSLFGTNGLLSDIVIQ